MIFFENIKIHPIFVSSKLITKKRKNEKTDYQ